MTAHDRVARWLMQTPLHDLTLIGHRIGCSVSEVRRRLRENRMAAILKAIGRTP